VQATFTNTNQTQTFTPELIVIAITNGVAEIIEGGGFNSIDAPVTKEDILQVSRQSAIPLSEDMIASLTGGSFFGDLWSGIKNVAKGAYNLVAPHAAGVAERLLPLAAAKGEQYVKGRLGLGRPKRMRGAGLPLMAGSELPLMARADEMDSDEDEYKGGSHNRALVKRMRGSGFVDDDASPEQVKFEETYARASHRPLNRFEELYAQGKSL